MDGAFTWQTDLLLHRSSKFTANIISSLQLAPQLPGSAFTHLRRHCLFLKPGRCRQAIIASALSSPTLCCVPQALCMQLCKPWSWQKASGHLLTDSSLVAKMQQAISTRGPVHKTSPAQMCLQLETECFPPTYCYTKKYNTPSTKLTMGSNNIGHRRGAVCHSEYIRLVKGQHSLTHH